MLKLQYLLLISLLFLAGCSSSVYIDDGVLRLENGSAAMTGGIIQTESINDFYLEVAEAKYNDYSYIHKFGRNDDIDSASGFEAIWNGGSDYTGFPTSAETLQIRSADVDDTYGGTGAWTVKITGLLNSTCHEQPDVYINLTGTTWVSLGAELYYRGSRMSIVKAGTSEFNEGAVTLRQTTTTANIFAVMPAEYGSTMITALTIPRDSKAFLNSWYASLGNKARGVSTVRLMMRPEGEAWQVKEEFSILADGSSYVIRQYKVPKNNIAPCTDIKVMADADINNLGVAAGMDFILEAVE